MKDLECQSHSSIMVTMLIMINRIKSGHSKLYKNNKSVNPFSILSSCSSQALSIPLYIEINEVTFYMRSVMSYACQVSRVSFTRVKVLALFTGLGYKKIIYVSQTSSYTTISKINTKEPHRIRKIIMIKFFNTRCTILS